MSLVISFIIGISLSMDAFSLALAYGLQSLDSKKTYILSIIVGLYHFFMPLLGFLIGKNIVSLLPIKANVLVFIVLFLIGLEMIIETFREEIIISAINLWGMLIFGLAVSIDSFSLGLSLKSIYHNPYFLSFMFAVLSSFFTYLGLKLGRYINQKIGPISTLIGGIILIIISLFYLV